MNLSISSRNSNTLMYRMLLEIGHQGNEKNQKSYTARIFFQKSGQFSWKRTVQSSENGQAVLLSKSNTWLKMDKALGLWENPNFK